MTTTSRGWCDSSRSLPLFVWAAVPGAPVVPTSLDAPAEPSSPVVVPTSLAVAPSSPAVLTSLPLP